MQMNSHICTSSFNDDDECKEKIVYKTIYDLEKNIVTSEGKFYQYSLYRMAMLILKMTNVVIHQKTQKGNAHI